MQHMNVGVPASMQRPRAARGQPRLTKKEWEDSEPYLEAAARFTVVKLTSKIDVVVDDMKAILAAAEERGQERPVKIVIFSNFAEAFARIAETCEQREIPYGYGPALCAGAARAFACVRGVCSVCCERS